MQDLINNPEFWVLVAFLIFMALVVHLKAPGAVAKSLDQRAAAIAAELDEARRLREDAQALLADYQKKAKAADEEARGIIDAARREAEAMAVRTRQSLAEQLERRSRQAEEKISRAEAQAVGEVRAAAVDAALRASETIVKGRLAGPSGATLIDASINGLKGRLN